jgi:hypothetical protein
MIAGQSGQSHHWDSRTLEVETKVGHWANMGQTAAAAAAVGNQVLVEDRLSALGKPFLDGLIWNRTANAALPSNMFVLGASTIFFCWREMRMRNVKYHCTILVFITNLRVEQSSWNTILQVTG